MRHAASTSIRQYFDENGFIEVNTPVLTSSDCEGAGEQFKVMSDTTAIQEQERRTEKTTTTSKEGDKGTIAKKKTKWHNDFFDTEVGLTVSGQLQAEMAACALSRVYTFGPTFRADNSNTRNHLAGISNYYRFIFSVGTQMFSFSWKSFG